MSFKLTSVAHFFAGVVSEVKSIGNFLAAHQAQIDSAAQVGVAVVSVIDPAIAPLATLLERAGEQLLGKTIEAIQTAGSAADQKGLNLMLDTQLVADIKSLIPLIEKMKPGSMTPPAGLPLSTNAALIAG